MKPDWKDAPDWAQWLAMDSLGEYWWYEEKPDINGIFLVGWDVESGNLELAQEMFMTPIEDRYRWRESLERRPE